jgi:hypothetical protein
VVRRAAELGLPTPLNRRIVDIVHACEQGRRTPTPAALSELAELVTSDHG